MDLPGTSGSDTGVSRPAPACTAAGDHEAELGLIDEELALRTWPHRTRFTSKTEVYTPAEWSAPVKADP